MAVIEQGVLKWSRMLIAVIVLLINTTRIVCVFSLISVPYGALRNVLILLTLKPVAKLVFLLQWEEGAMWKWWCKTLHAPGFTTIAAHPHVWALGILAVLWDLLLTCYGDRSGVSGQQNWIVTQRFKNDWVSNFPCSFITVSFAFYRIIYCRITSSTFLLLYVIWNFNKKGIV